MDANIAGKEGTVPMGVWYCVGDWLRLSEVDGFVVAILGLYGRGASEFILYGGPDSPLSARDPLEVAVIPRYMLSSSSSGWADICLRRVGPSLKPTDRAASFLRASRS